VIARPAGRDLERPELEALVGEIARRRDLWAPPPRGTSSASPPPTSTASATAARGPAVGIHAYSPPLWPMGAYEISPDGALRHHSVSYADELRPLAAAAAG
jgi:hypothetical protein